MKLINILVILMCPFFVKAQKQYDLVRDFGAKGDNKTDCYAAFKKAAEVISAAKGGILNIPKGKYYIAKYKISGPGSNGVTDIIFMNCSLLKIKGNGSLIRMNGNFTRTADYTIPGSGFSYSHKNSVSPITIRNSQNVTLTDLILDGGVKEMKKEIVAEGECNGIVIDDLAEKKYSSSHISITNVVANYFATDGFYVRSNGTDIKIINCSGKYNARQGLSLVGGEQILVSGCSFDSTGVTGAYGSHAPSAGIDVENELGAGGLKNVVIKNCSMRANLGFQLVTTLQSENVTVDSCFIADLSEGYGDGLNGVGLYSLNSTLSNSIIFGSWQIDLAGQIYKGPAIQSFKNNVLYSGNRAIISSDFARPVNISGNLIIMLPQAAVNEFFPYIQNVNAVFSNNIIVVQADKISKVPAGQISGLVQYVKESKNNIWLITGFSTGAKQAPLLYYPISFLGNVTNQFYQDNNAYDKSHGFLKKINSATTKTVLQQPVFTAFKQSKFERKYLIQANTAFRLSSAK